MIEHFVTLLLVLSVWIAYSLYLLPRRKMEKYRKMFEAKGYSVYMFPFKFMGVPELETLMQKGPQHPDSMKIVKEQYSKHDVIISNFIGTVSLNILHPDLQKEFYSHENVYAFPKARKVIDPTIRGTG